MLHHVVSRNNFVHTIIRNVATSNRSSTSSTPFRIQIPSPLISTSISRFISNNVSNPQNLTVDYLTNSCGLSPESALKASKHLLLKSTTGPDSVLSLFNSYGFTKPQISKIVMLKPLMLLANPDKSLKPKLEYFSNMGIAGPDLANLISACPSILGASLENTIIPSVNYLRSLVGTDNRVTFILKKSWWTYQDAERIIGPNIAILRDHGVPQSNIFKYLMLFPQTLYRNSDLFKEKVIQVVNMGVSPLTMTFIYGINVFMQMKVSSWEEKMAVYMSYGWSENEVLALFKKQPFIMSHSVKKINLALDFLMNNLNWTREEIARNSTVIHLSLAKRVIPRCHVLQILLSKNLITKTCMGHALRVAENMFLMKYVSKFHDEVPDLLKVYQCKMSTQDLRVGSESECNLLDKV